MTGLIDFDRDLLAADGVIRAMTASLAHRGPDDDGVWLSRHAALGHRRLAIIDLEGGRQPMVHRNGAEDVVCLVYTGEAYNFESLRAELRSLGHVFSTRSDTEVVLRGYLQWGEDVATRLVGMYAFAIWEELRQELLLVRDRLGIKPLYYAELPSGILFGSEPKAIFASGLCEAAVDAEGLCELLSLVRTPGVAVYRGIKEVRPAELVRVTRRGITSRRYWALDAHEHPHDLPTTIQVVRDLLHEIVGEQLVADVPVAALLSGGLDSATVTALAQARRRRDRAEPMGSITVGFDAPEDRREPRDDDDDVGFAARTAHYLGTEHRAVMLSTDGLTSAAVARAALEARDLPPFGDIDGPLYLLCKAIRQHSTVALSGEGADEIFGGYDWFHDERAVAADTFPWLAAGVRLGRAAAFEPKACRALDIAAYQRRRYHEAIAEVPRLRGEDGLERRMREVFWFHLTRFLPNPLDRKDRLSMASGLEIRVPYCDHRVVEYLFNVPWAMKTFNGRPKSLLRAAATGLVPDFVLTRQKVPFPAPTDPGYHELLRIAVLELLHCRRAPVLSILNRPTVRALASMPPSGARLVRLGLERILSLNDWLERYRVRVAM
jgi:asparagine synthase (glutamine-hydrolysing)